MSGPTTFSYAQAAKGHAATQSAPSQSPPTQSQAPSVNGSQSREPRATNTSIRASSVAKSTTSNDIDASRSAQSFSTKSEASRFANSSDADIKSNPCDTAASVTESTGSLTLEDKQESENASKNLGSSADSMSSSSHPADAQNKTSKKGRKGKTTVKDGESSKDQDNAPPRKVELSEAPIPTVNVWAKRAEAAKSRASADASRTGSASSTSLATANSGQEVQGSKQNQTTESMSGASNGSKSLKKEGEPHRNNGSQGPKRAGPRGTRTQDREAESLNLVANNSASWPTPETATVNSKVQPPNHPEKDEKDESGSAKSRKWLPIPFNHSVVFETTFSTRGGRGGRGGGGSRGGRDTAGHSHHSTTPTERAQEPTSGSRTNPGPKRSPGESSGPREGRKGAAQSEHSKAPKETISESQPGLNGIVNGTATLQSTTRASTTNHRPEEANKHTESHKDVRLSNKDAHHSGQNGTNHRSGERTRGGGRGRGNFSNQNNANGVSHHTQQPFVQPPNGYSYMPNGSQRVSHYPPTGYQPMPYTVPYQTQPVSNHRKPGSMSGNRGPSNGRVQNSRMPAMPPMGMHYDTTTMYHPVNDIMPQPEQVSQLQLVLMRQVEYYFSVDNCIKDIFLRKHMDSQGFVDLKVIGDFPRIKEMGFDYNLLVQACHESALLELIIGEDGVVRVRTKEGWERWVVSDMDQRHPSARHDGPTSWHLFSPYQHVMMSPGYLYEAPPMFSPTGDHSFSHYPNGNYGPPPLTMPATNGINGHATPHESQLSAAVPEFSPSASSGFQPGAYNQGEVLKAKPDNGPVSSAQQASVMTNGTSHDHTESKSSPHLTNGDAASH